MPLFSRRSSPPLAYAVPTYEAVPSKSVGFVPGATPITSISRPLANDELWRMYDYECHARLCGTCRDALQVHRSGRSLCDEGHRLAQLVAGFARSSNSGMDVYDAMPQGGSVTRLEMPHDYFETRNLFRAMERSLRHPRQRPIVSFRVLDKAPVAAFPYSAKNLTRRNSTRQSTSPSQKKSSAESSPSRPKSVRVAEESPESFFRREPEIVDWPAVEYTIREPSQIIQPSKSKESNRASKLRTPEPTEVPELSPSRSSPSKRTSYYASSTPRRTVIETSPTPSRRRSTTIPSSDRDDRRRSMYDDYSRYSTEIREPKSRPKRYSTLMF